MGAVVALLLALGLTTPASAAAAGLTTSQPDPVVGETVTYTTDLTSDCSLDITFSVDGVVKQVRHSGDAGLQQFQTAFATTGDHTVEVEATNASATGCGPQGASLGSASLDVTVKAGLAGTIAVAPDPPIVGQPAALSATQTGGSVPYTYAWDTDDDGAFDDASTRTTSPTFTTTGPHVVRVRIRDGAIPVHETITTRTLNVVDPPAPGTPAQPGAPAAPAPAPCTKKLDFALSELTTEGCFTETGTSPSARWETTSEVKLNGIPFPDYGQQFVVTFPDADHPGGRFQTTNAAIQIGSFTALTGDVDFSLPDGRQGEEKTVRSISVPSRATLFGLKVRGSIDLRIGWSANGTHYATFPLNIELPATFRAGPSDGSGTVTGTASLKVDDAGVHYDGLKLEADDVWAGRIKVVHTCFSFVPSGGQSVEPCEAPSLDGQPYITCATDSGTDRWDGNAVIELPTASSTRLAAFGGLADGHVAKLGGFVDDLGTTVPIVPGVFLNRIGVGLCLSPPPLKLRGDVGVSALPSPKGPILDVNGHVLYTDQNGSDPWSLEVGGNVKVLGTQVGDGSVTFNAWGDVDFALHAGIDLFGLASIDGQASGWIEPRNDLFNVSGQLKACITGLPCATASGLISSSGLAGCLDLGEIVVPEPVDARTGPFGFGSVSFSVRLRHIPLRAGFGYRFGTGKVDLLGGSCDFSPYEATRGGAPTTRAATRAVDGQPAATTLTERIAAGTKAVTLRVHGTDGPPKIVLRDPHGATITSPVSTTAEQQRGRYTLTENTTDGTTSVLLMAPKAGTWTVAAAPGASSRPTTVDRSDYEAPPTLIGRTRATAKGREVLVAYAVPAGASLRLAERGPKIGQTIVRSVKGRPCRGAHALPDGRRLRCVRASFRPSRGPGGKRTVEAIVTRGGMPLARKAVATFIAPRETMPSRPGALRARRVRSGALVVAFPRTAGASRYTATAVLSDGRRLGFDLSSKCRALRIPDVPRGVRADVKVAGVRYDLRTGRYRRIVLKSGSDTAGPFRRLPYPCR